MFNLFFKKLFLFIYIALMTFACHDSSNPASTSSLEGLIVSGFDESIATVEVHGHEEEDEEGEEEHEVASGFILENENEQEIYRQFQGTVTGSISVSKGETLELTIHLLDSSEQEIVHEEEEHEMEIEITGVETGTTTFSIEFWHDGHIDWSSTNLIEITVIE
tara:strand:+ start:420 stop:908 length:489 start_codon:yes stop_codon:yes gene_type:complete